jgi:MFS family permease
MSESEPREAKETPPPVANAGITRGAYGRIMRNRSFRNLWIGQTISGVGDWLVVGLLIPLVIDLAPDSSMAIAGIMIAKIVPSLLIGGVLGALVDRWDRRRLMIGCDIINGILCLGLVTASAASAVPALGRLMLIYAFIFMMEICNLLFMPAKNAIIPMIVEEQDLTAANGLSYTTGQASMIIGLVAAGPIVAVFGDFLRMLMSWNFPFVRDIVAAQPGLIGPQGGIVVDFFSFMLSAALISTVRVPRNERRQQRLDLRMLGRDVLESFGILRAHKELRGFLASLGFAILGGGALTSVGLIYVQQLTGKVPVVDLVEPIQKVAEQARGMFMLVFMAIGTFAGAMIAPWIAKKVTLERLYVTGIGGVGIAMLGFSVVDEYWAAAAFAVAAGFLIAQGNVASNTYIVQTVADSVRGRVFAALESITRVAFLLAIVVTAPVGDLIATVVTKAVVDSGGDPARFSLSGPRITLIFASFIVLGAAVYASFKINWRARHPGRPQPDE